MLLYTPSNPFIHFLLVHSVIHFSQPALSISAPAQLDSSSNPSRTSAEASTSPATSPKPPARLTGRHFLGKRESGSDCKVCCHHKRKTAAEEEQEQKKRKEEEAGRTSDEEEANGLNLDKVNGGDKENWKRSEKQGNQTLYYCKTCSGEPSLCPVPCFEVYHTRLIYRTAPELETKRKSLQYHSPLRLAYLMWNVLKTPKKVPASITLILSNIRKLTSVLLNELKALIRR